VAVAADPEGGHDRDRYEGAAAREREGAEPQISRGTSWASSANHSFHLPFSSFFFLFLSSLLLFSYMLRDGKASLNLAL